MLLILLTLPDGEPKDVTGTEIARGVSGLVTVILTQINEIQDLVYLSILPLVVWWFS